MPVLWRYLLTHYLRVLLLCLVGLIGLLLVTQLNLIAKFAALGGAFQIVLLFTLNQIPLLLPIAIPISCLISVTLLFQRLSQTNELTAFRASGLSLQQVMTPILLAAAAVSILNFYIISEVSTASSLSNRRLKAQVLTLSPLLVLENPKLIRSSGLHASILGPSRSGEYSHDVVLSNVNPSSKQLNLFLIKKLTSADQTIIGENVSIVSGAKAEDPTDEDPLFIENIDHIRSPTSDYSTFFKKQGWRMTPKELNMGLLLIKTRAAMSHFSELKLKPNTKPHNLRVAKRTVQECLSEISRRFSISLAVITFTIMGAAFSVSIGRYPSPSRIFYMAVLTVVYITCFFVGKDFKHDFVLSTALYIVPHIVIMGLSIQMMSRISRGVE